MAKTLLLADDSVTIQRVVELTFAHEDVRVVAVADGRRAMQYLESERPDIVLLDVELPDVNGFEIVARIRRSPRLRHLPVLLLAGAFEAVDEGRARSSGSDGVIKKPFEPEQLVARVKELLAGGSGARAENVRDWSARPAPAAPAQPVPIPVPQVQAVAAAGGGGRMAEPVIRREPMAGAGGGGYTPDPPIRSVPGFPGLSQPTSTPEPLEPPRPIWETAAPRGPEPSRGAPAAPPKVSLSNAFSALLAAEQTNPAAAPAAATTVIISESAIEDVVRRVLVKMTDDTVHRIVLETAERLIREELDKIRHDE